MKKSDEIALTVAHLSCDEPPKGHYEHCQLVWKAFRLGQDYEKERAGAKLEITVKALKDYSGEGIGPTAAIEALREIEKL